jgi:ATP dependent DNA ligase C terminal region/Transposase C of IS166 homeodomain/zinc-finger binding domain of transposase IS66
VFEKLRSLQAPECPFANLPETGRSRWGEGLTADDMKKCIWVRPEIVAQIEFLEWTESDNLRHSKFAGLREERRQERWSKSTRASVKVCASVHVVGHSEEAVPVGFVAASRKSLQPCGPGFGLYRDGDIRIGIFPKRQEILIGGAGFGGVALHGVSAGKSEKVERQIEQVQLRLDELESKPAENEASSASVASAPAVHPARKPAPRPLPEHLPRETQTVLPNGTKCPECGGELKHLGEDVSEMLEHVPEHFKVSGGYVQSWPAGVATRSCSLKRRAVR